MRLGCECRCVEASPLINLARVGCFDLLAAFYGEIVIPQAVYDEVVVRGAGREGSREVDGASWIEVLTPQDELAVCALTAELGTGEASAIIPSTGSGQAWHRNFGLHCC